MLSLSVAIENNFAMGKKSRKVKNKAGGGSGGGGGGKSKASSTATSTKNADSTDLDKKCDARMAELHSAEKKGSGTKLRFSVGDRVQCKMHTHSDDDIMDFASLSMMDLVSMTVKEEGPFAMTYKPGYVVHVWYCDPVKSKGKIYPYQVRLDENYSLVCPVSACIKLMYHRHPYSISSIELPAYLHLFFF